MSTKMPARPEEPARDVVRALYQLSREGHRNGAPKWVLLGCLKVMAASLHEAWWWNKDRLYRTLLRLHEEGRVVTPRRGIWGLNDKWAPEPKVVQGP